MAINFFNQDISFKLPKPRKTVQWIRGVIQTEKRELVQLNYIFCSDKYLLKINKQFLKHNTLTDIITFDNSGGAGPIEGDIFISIDMVKDNARAHKVEFDEEIHRVMVHGVLHLLGYSDKLAAKKNEMRKKEDAYLSLRR